MRLPTCRAAPLAALAYLSACGGRVTSDASSNDSGAVAGTTDGDIGGSPVVAGASGSMGNQPPDSEQPPFDTPWWLSAKWQDNIGNPVTDQCRAGMTAEEGVAAIRSLGDQASAQPVDAPGLQAAIAQFRNPETRYLAPSSIVLHVFATPEGQLGGVSVVRRDDGLDFYYFVLAPDCKPVRLGFYAEHSNAVGCDRVDSSTGPLWGVPELSPELRACYATSGYYAFEGRASEDTCARTPGQFVGVFGLRQPNPGYAEVLFVETPFAEHRRMTFGVTLNDGAGSALIAGDNECGPRTAQLWLDENGPIRIEDDRIRCDTDPERHCTWKMQSPKVYGPLN